MFELAVPAIKDFSLLMSSALVLILLGLLVLRPHTRALRFAYCISLLLFFVMGVVHMFTSLLHWDIGVNAAMLLVVNNLMFMCVCWCFWFGPRFLARRKPALHPDAAADSKSISGIAAVVPAAPLAQAPDDEIPTIDAQPQLAEKLTEFMQEKKPYLEPHITVERLAIKLQVSPKLLSATINSELQVNFFELISHYRVQEAKLRLADASLQEKPICEIMKSCGFNSKSVFNQAFKKAVGVTPSLYRQQHINQQDARQKQAYQRPLHQG